jgi:hypothetical protein
LSKATRKKIEELEERLASREEELKLRCSEVQLFRAWMNRIYDEVGVHEFAKLERLLPDTKVGRPSS